MEIEIKKPETTTEEEKSKTNDSILESVWNKITVFYNKNKKELIVVLCLLIVYNFICPISYEFVRSNKQFGGEGEELAQLVQGSSGEAAAPAPAAAPAAAATPVPSEKDVKKAEKIAEKQAKQAAKQMPGKDSKIKLFAKKLKGVNVLQKMLGWMLSLVQSLMTFAGLVLVLAILPGLPIFIFMLILFFILRARVAVIKAY